MPLVHVHTTFPENVLLKQFPGGNPTLGGFDFTFGVQPAKNADAIIVHRFLMQSFRSSLSRERLAFICGEPPEIHTYKRSFLDQFGLVVSPYPMETSARQIIRNYRCVWYAGLSMNRATMWETRKDVDFFREHRTPPKIDKIVVISTRKKQTEFHIAREEFILKLKMAFPDRLDIFGINTSFVDDKFDVLSKYKYTLAAENTDTPRCWSEKLSDPLLCWTLPLYIGPSKDSIDLPSDAYIQIDLKQSDSEIDRIGRLLDENIWKQKIPAIEEARRQIIDQKNIAHLFVEVCQEIVAAGPIGRRAYQIVLCEQLFLKDNNKWSANILRTLLRVFPNFQIFKFQIKHSRAVHRLTTPAKNLRAKIKRLNQHKN